MNKIFKGAVLSILALAGLASCSDDFDYTPAQAPTGMQVYFPTSNPSTYALKKADETQTITLSIERVDSTEAITVPLELTVAQHPDVFAIPSEVSFAAGASKAIIPLSYDVTNMEYETSDTLSITIGENFSTPYGINEYQLIVTLPSPLKLLGTGKWTDYYMFGVEDVPVEIYQNELYPNLFRVMLNYEEIVPEGAGVEANGLQSAYTEITLLQVGDVLGGVPITRPDMVYFTPFDMGYANSTGEMVSYHPLDFGWANEAYYATSYVDQYQENGLPGTIMLSGLILVDFEGGRGWAPCNDGEPIAIITFPGFEPADYSATVSYAGTFTDTHNNVFAVGNLTLGADAKTVKAVVMEAGVDAAAVADAIAAGDLEAVDVAAGRIEVPIAEGLSGKLQIIVAVLDGNELKDWSAISFEYFGGGVNPWKSIGVGMFVDDYVIPAFGYDPEPYPVEIEENTETPGLYRLVDMYAGVVADFGKVGGYESVVVHAENPNGVYVMEQPIGWDAGYGDMAIVTEGGDYVGYYGDFDYVYRNAPQLFGTLEDGVMTFPSFERTDGKGIYQGYLIMGEGAYYGGMNGAFEIYLPSALESNAQLQARVKGQKQAAEFSKRLKNGYKVNNAKRAFSKKMIKAVEKVEMRKF